MRKVFLITYSFTDSLGHWCTANEVTVEDPLVWLCKVRGRQHPFAVLLSAVEVAQGPHVKRILTEFDGKPSSVALEKKSSSTTKNQ